MQTHVLRSFFLQVDNAEDGLPIPGYDAARDVPNAQLLPDPNVEHKVVFDAVRAAENIDDVNPMLVAVARYLNTLAKYDVPPENILAMRDEFFRQTRPPGAGV